MDNSKDLLKIGFIGIGNMGGAILKSVLQKGIFSQENIGVFDKDKTRLSNLKKYNLFFASNNLELSKWADILFICVKPQNFEELFSEIGPKIKGTVVSIMAGISTHRIKEYTTAPIVRVMPNTPLMCNKGVIGIFIDKKGINEQLQRILIDIFSCTGEVFLLEEEKLIDVITAISGSGPAYFFLIMEQMIKKAEKWGLPTEDAMNIVINTCIGAGELVRYSKETPEQLRKKVTSPGGTTEAAVKYLFENNFEEIFQTALERAYQRAAELGR